MIYMVKVAEDLFGTQVVQAWGLVVTSHGESFPRASLPICEAWHLGAHEGTVDKRLYARVVYLLVIRSLVERKIEVKSGFLNVFGEIDFLSASV